MERIGDLEEPAAGQPGGESAQAPGPAPSLPPAGERPAVAETVAGTTAAAAAAAASSGSPSPEVNYPLGAFGRDGPPELLDRFALTNATIWTCGPPGKLEQATLLVERGKIAAIGTNLQLPADTRRIDVGGRHVTPGIIDCHSHMATDGGVNESGQAITAEVRIGDFIDANDISIYRQLAGGVTTANILHGSANPIGGQNQLIKLRWGSLPEQLKLAGAPGGIKFALGENVKQSNSQSSTRYPQTRMGVEQLIRDALHAAQAYDLRRREWQDRGTGLPPRRDLELDALAEVLNHQRWIHCHSYRQDEILAVLRTLESFDVQMGTLQHVLEGYKVAEVLRRHGAMASAFSDWWAYKFEVFDAIPYNGALMHEAGVVVSFNSDDQELARHLNQEAAKAVKYGNVPAEEALKFVTLNPARQLRIDDQVGSLEVGKDADFVVWSNQPLSNFSRCEQTWIDGRRYFDMDQDRQWRERDETLRRKLIAQIIDSGEAMLPADEKPPREADLWPREDEFCKRNDHGR
jgi:N-acetylglucosamine-6-phosphate deacetylase